MGSGSPIADLPETVTFTLDEVALLLFVADSAVESTTDRSSQGTRARSARRLITSKLWPELADLLGDDQREGE